MNHRIILGGFCLSLRRVVVQHDVLISGFPPLSGVFHVSLWVEAFHHMSLWHVYFPAVVSLCCLQHHWYCSLLCCLGPSSIIAPWMTLLHESWIISCQLSGRGATAGTGWHENHAQRQISSPSGSLRISAANFLTPLWKLQVKAGVTQLAEQTGTSDTVWWDLLAAGAPAQRKQLETSELCHVQ